MRNYDEYGMSDVKRPTITDFTVNYYYLYGKVTGIGEMVNGVKKYYRTDENFDKVEVEFGDIEFSTQEKLVDEAALKRALCEYNELRHLKINKFKHMLMEEYDVSSGIVEYMFSREYDNGFESVEYEISELVEFIRCEE